jgi:2-haloacid dehalogenase
MIRTILFDLDDTLLDFKWAEKRALSHTLLSYGIEPSQSVTSRYSEINSEYWRELERGRLTREEVMLFRFQRLFEEINVECSAEEFSRQYESNLANGDNKVIEGAEGLLEGLRGKFVLSVASNGTRRIQSKRLTNSGLKHYFDHIFISEDIGVNKPSAKFFDRCLERSGFQAREALMVGDRIASDIKGAVAAGVSSVWFNPSGTVNNTGIHPDYEVGTLSEIAALPPLRS